MRRTEAQPRIALFPVLAAVGSGVSFSVATVLARIAFERGADVETIVLGRLTIGVLLLWSLVAVLRIPVRPSGRRVMLLLALGVLPSTQIFLLYRSVALIPASVATLLLYSYPAIVTLLVLMLGRERVGPAKVVALGLSIGGLVLVLGLPNQPLAPGGIVYGLLAAFVLALWIVTAEAVTKDVAPLLSATLLLSGGAVSYGLVSLFTRSTVFAASDWAWSVPIGGAAALAMLLILVALRHIPPTTVSIGSTVEPVSTSVLGALLLSEFLGAPQVLGGLLIIVGVVTAVRARGGQIRTIPSSDPLVATASDPVSGDPEVQGKD